MSTRKIREALEPLAKFVAAFDAKPLRQVDDVIYGIHHGSEHEADIRLSDLRKAVAALAEVEAIEKAAQDLAAWGDISPASQDPEEQEAVGQAEALLVRIAKETTP